MIRGERTDVFRTRQSSLAAHLPLLDAQWAAGCRSGAELWRRLQEHGFRGSLRVVSEWTTWRRRADTASDQQLQRVPSARTIARLMTIGRDHLSKADTVPVAAIGRDKAAVAAAIREPWSNGQTEGQVNRLKLIKRSMYGRAKVDLIEARLIGAI